MFLIIYKKWVYNVKKIIVPFRNRLLPYILDFNVIVKQLLNEWQEQVSHQICRTSPKVRIVDVLNVSRLINVHKIALFIYYFRQKLADNVTHFEPTIAQNLKWEVWRPLSLNDFSSEVTTDDHTYYFRDVKPRCDG